jgi:flagellar assembly protein FliH
MSGSRPAAPRQVPPPTGGTARNTGSYSRFIPREELQGFESWTPDPFGGRGPGTQHGNDAASQAPAQEAQQPAGPTHEEMEAAVAAARSAGYQDGYRDGLVALDSFKQSFAQQMSAQLGAMVAAFGDEFDALERDIADSVARVATQLARQVVRHELSVQPELVARVAAEAVNAVLMSADRIVVHVHPEDHALVAQGAAEALAARGARLMADAGLQRGGCRVESDAGIVDASVPGRWAQAVANLGTDVPWQEPGRAD